MNPQSTHKPSKTSDLEVAREYARRLRMRLGDNLVGVTLFGSRARGTAQDGSDFDLIVVVRQLDNQTSEVVTDLDVDMMNEFEELFAAVVYSEEEWRDAQVFPLARNVLREGIVL